MATEPPLLPVPPPVVPDTLRLEILKTLQTASFNRWEKRRNYEWLLSYAIWFGLAGFIAFVALGKDTQFKPPESWNIGTYCQSCTQYLAPTQSQAVRPEPTRSSVKPGHR
jgi:hypothetical protein